MHITQILIHQPIGLLRLQTDTDLEGWCFGVGSDEGRMIQEAYAGAVIGQNPIDRERLWLELVGLDRNIVPTTLRSYLDTALWDLAAKAVGLPVYRMIGGFRSRVPVYLAGGSHDDTLGVIQEALQAQQDGFLGYKITCHQTSDRLFGLIREIRQAVGSDFYLMLDGARQNRSTGAVRIGRILDEADFYWFEEPIEERDPLQGGCIHVADEIDTPVALRARTNIEVSRILSVQAADMIIASTPASGGITDVLKIGRAADAFGVFCLIGSEGISPGFAHAHLLGAIKNAPFFEAKQAGVIDNAPFIKNPLNVVNGYLDIPQAPGLGLEPDWDMIDERTELIIDSNT